MRYSIIFLDYDPEAKNMGTTHQALTYVLTSSGDYDYELIHVKNVKGYVNAVNEGLRRAKGDFIAQVANDVFLNDRRWLEKMTQENALVGWRLTPFYLTGEPRPDFACWGVSRETFEKLGYMDERFAEGYGFDDDDYVFRARELGIEIKDAAISLNHLESLTYNTLFKDEKQGMTYRNEALFREKWAHKLPQ